MREAASVVRVDVSRRIKNPRSTVDNDTIGQIYTFSLKEGFIVDGRDICSVVLPDAEVKIFMSASSKARAQRRYDEYISKGIDADYETIYQDIVARDYQDMHREISPLVKTEDAVEIDTSDLTIDEVVSKVLDIVG